MIELREGFNAVRPQLWTGRARDLLAPVAYIDVDGTLAPTLGTKKEGMDMSYKGVWGYHPLIVSLANTGEVLYLVNRPGNVPSHSGAAEWPGGAPRRAGVRARGHGLLADGPLRPLERGGGLHLRLRRPAGDGEAGRGAGGERMEASGAPAAPHVPDGEDAAQARRREGPDRAGARLPEPEAELRACGRVRIPAGQVPQDVPDGRRAQEHQQD